MSVTERTVTAICPDCNEDIEVDSQSEEGDTIVCSECWASLRVISLEPLTLTWDTFEAEDDDENEDADDDDEDNS